MVKFTCTDLLDLKLALDSITPEKLKYVQSQYLAAGGLGPTVWQVENTHEGAYLQTFIDGKRWAFALYAPNHG